MGDVKGSKNKSKRAANDSFELSKYAERLLENINDLVQSIGTDGKFVYVNRKWRETLGYSLQEVKGMSFEDILRRDQIEHCGEIFQGLLTGDKYENIETVFVTKKGEEIYVEGNVNAVVEDGKVEVTIGVFHDITEHKCANEALQQSEERFRQMVDLLPEAVCELDTSGNILFGNRAAFMMAGYDETDFEKGLNILPMIAPEDHDRAFSNIQKMMAGEALGADEYTLVHKDGSRFPATVHIANILNASGKTIGFRGIIVDITERKKIEEFLRESEERLKILFEYAPDAYTLSTLDGTIVDANSRAFELTGYSREEVIGKSFISMGVIPLEQFKVGSAATAHRPDEPLELVLNRKDGTKVTVETNTFSVEVKGQPLLLSISRDITERKRAEEIQQHLVAIVESSHDAIIGKTLDGIITSWNKGAEKRYGYSAAEVVGHPISILIPPERADEMPQFLAKVGRGEAVIDYESERIAKDGRRVTVLLTISPIKDTSGKIVGASTIAQDITERKRLYEVLMESEERFRVMSTTAQDAVIMIDGNGNISFWNNAAVKMFGYSNEEAMGLSLHKFLAPERFHEKHFKAFTEFQRTGQGMAVGKTLEMAALRKNGEEFPIELSLSSVEIKGSWHAIGIVRDITERRRAEKKLNDSEQRFTAIFRYSPASTSLTRLSDGKFLDVNDAFLRMTGYEREEIIGSTALDLNLWGDPESRAKVVAQLREQGRSPSAETTWRKKSGGIIDVIVEAELIDVGGEQYSLGLITDITEHKRLEDLLKESEQKFRELADFLPQTIFEIDLEGHLTYANRYGFESTGYTRENLEKGINAIELFVSEQRDRIAKNILAVLSGEKFDDHEYSVLRKDGSTYPVLIYSNIIMCDGKPVGVRGIVLDITERKKIEQMKTDFVSFISHQLRTPVAGLMGYIDNMLDGVTGELNSKQIEYLSGMRGVCERNSRLIADLLNISRIERGVLTLNISPVDLRSVVDSAVKEHRKSIEEKGLVLSIKEADQGIVVLADIDKLVEVLKNVIHNAAKFTSKGSISIEIVAEGQRGIVKVSDTGMGMSKEALQNLFKKDKVMSGAAVVGGGAGLGLYIAKGFMQLQGGDIEVESVIGKGSTFTIILPRE